MEWIKGPPERPGIYWLFTSDGEFILSMVWRYNSASASGLLFDRTGMIRSADDSNVLCHCSPKQPEDPPQEMYIG